MPAACEATESVDRFRRPERGLNPAFAGARNSIRRPVDVDSGLMEFGN